MKIRTAFSLALLLCSSGVAAEFLVTEIGAFKSDGTGESVAYGINESGVVVGSAQNEQGRYAPFRWSASSGLLNLDTNSPPAVNAYAVDINDAGEICGTVTPFFNPVTFAFRSFGNGLSLMETLENARDGQGLGINNGGTIVGWSNEGARCGGPECATSPGFATKWIGTNITKLGGLGGHFSVAYGINDAGEICGYGSLPGSNAVHAFRIPKGGQPTDLGTLGGASSRALAINNSGTIVGWAETSANTNSHGAIWVDGAIEDLGQVPGKVVTIAYAISDNGLIVGYAAGPDYAEARAVFYRRGSTPIDLNTLIDPNSGWTLQFATGVNTAGQITAYGLRNGIRRGALLTPNLQLTIARINNAQAEIRWSAFFLGYGVETSANAATWEPLNASPDLSANEFVLRTDLNSSSRFFRLRRL